MDEGSPVDIRKELIELQRRERNLRELLSIPRVKMDKEDLVSRLREVRSETARIEAQLHARHEPMV
jgi:hypothetical protein